MLIPPACLELDDVLPARIAASRHEFHVPANAATAAGVALRRLDRAALDEPEPDQSGDPDPPAPRGLNRERGISRLRLTLDPPELGEIRLDLTLRGGVLRASFQAAAPGAAEALRSGLGGLRSALEKRGLRVGELSVAGPEAGPLPPGPSTPGRLDLRA